MRCIYPRGISLHLLISLCLGYFPRLDKIGNRLPKARRQKLCRTFVGEVVAVDPICVRAPETVVRKSSLNLANLG
jgi:hypothetical protein